MGITANFTREDVKARIDKALARIENQMIDQLIYLGELCVTHARGLPEDVGFRDQTGHLRGSIGYVVFKNGIAIHDGFKVTGDGSEGVAEGRALARKVGAELNSGYALVVTAGMSYAVHVESMGKDVLTSAELLAKSELPVMLDELRKNIRRSIV